MSYTPTDDERNDTTMYIFISHSSKNAEIAHELCTVIESNGSQCFLAPRNIRSGYEYASEIINGIDRSDAMLLVLSKEINDSPHVLREIERAVSKSIPIIVYKLEEVALSKSLEYFLMTHQWLNAEKGSHEHLLKCIADLKDDTVTAFDTAKNIEPVQTKTKSKKLHLCIGIASVALLALVISLCLVLSNSNKSNETNKTENDSTNNSVSYVDVELGDTVVLGKYNDADIYWKVIKISDDGSEAVLIARDLLTFKSFSAAESGRCYWDGKTNYAGSDTLKDDLELQAYVKGNSDWSSSTIRTWLNSDSDSVNYNGAIPTNLAMSDGKNGYNTESGFLYGFSDEELDAIKETTIETKTNALYDVDVTTTTDRVFLLSIEELEWLKEANVSLYAAPTEEAIERNESPWYREQCLVYSDSCIWWLRDPVSDNSSECYAVSFSNLTDELYYPHLVSVEDFCIRPAITVDLSSKCIKVED